MSLLVCFCGVSANLILQTPLEVPWGLISVESVNLILQAPLDPLGTSNKSRVRKSYPSGPARSPGNHKCRVHKPQNQTQGSSSVPLLLNKPSTRVLCVHPLPLSFITHRISVSPKVSLVDLEVGQPFYNLRHILSPGSQWGSPHPRPHK